MISEDFFYCSQKFLIEIWLNTISFHKTNHTSVYVFVLSVSDKVNCYKLKQFTCIFTGTEFNQRKIQCYHRAYSKAFEAKMHYNIDYHTKKTSIK